MNQDYPDFLNRVQRIDEARRTRVHGEFVLLPNGLMVPRHAVSEPRRGHGVAPLRGLVVALVCVVAVKAYLIWFLGVDAYTGGVMALVDGASFEQAASLLMLPDDLSLAVAGFYDRLASAISAFRNAG